MSHSESSTRGNHRFNPNGREAPKAVMSAAIISMQCRCRVEYRCRIRRQVRNDTVTGSARRSRSEAHQQAFDVRHCAGRNDICASRVQVCMVA